jgi:FdhD protein
VELPLEIRVEGEPAAITMRTPGEDLDLVAGFLWTEGVIDGLDDIRALAHVDDPGRPEGNTVDVVLAEGVPAGRRRQADREFFSSSSCGVCGKATLERLLVAAPHISQPHQPSTALLLSLPARLEEAQAAFARTGGLHGAALFNLDGELLVAREDIGRHNAVDKVLGHMLRNDQSCSETILLVSSRASFEILQKALVARVPVVAAIGAPSSMAVELAAQAQICLVGFLRDGRYNLYRGPA